MYQFHYDYVLKTFNEAKLFTDTGSLVYEINVYISLLKTSTYLISVDIQKILLIMMVQIKKFLEKLNGVKIVEFVGLKSKM